MTRPDLDAIRARADAATPGPWEVEPPHYSPGTRPDDCYDVMLPAGWDLVGSITYPDAAFIAHAREDVPALLDEVERLQRYHDPRCISLTDSEYNASCDCLTLAAIDEHEVAAERDEARATKDMHKERATNAEARLCAVQVLLAEYETDDEEHLARFGQHHPYAGWAADHLRAALADHP